MYVDWCRKWRGQTSLGHCLVDQDLCDHVRTGSLENFDQDMSQWWNGSVLESGIHSFWLLF